MSIHTHCLAERRRRRISIDRSVPRCGGAKSRRVDLGLALLSVLVKPGRPLTQEDIALWCGCSRGGIYMLEQRAMKKLRNKFLFGRGRGAAQELVA